MTSNQKNAFPNEHSDIARRFDRRSFIKITAAAGAATGFCGHLWADTEAKNGIPYRILGRTGEKVSVIGLGGFHLGSASSLDEAIRMARTAIDRGINFMDNCWDYHDGKSEEWMGKALRDGYREKAFLMTKIDGRDKKSAAKQIDESLSRLQTDHLDLLQLHEIIRMEDPDRIFTDGGAIEAVNEAKKAGKIRYAGFTGHKSPEIHLKMLEVAEKHDYHFATVQMPLNVMDAHFNSFEKLVLPKLVEKRIGVLGMKPMGSGIILKSKTVEPIECLHYAMNLPTSVVITGCEKMSDIDQAIQAAKTFRPLEKSQVTQLLTRTAEAAGKGDYELYKTSHHFDGTYQHPQWLG